MQTPTVGGPADSIRWFYVKFKTLVTIGAMQRSCPAVELGYLMGIAPARVSLILASPKSVFS
jgi:hypothetical protein